MRINIDQALNLLHTGNVVAIPTETVYGLAADMHNQAAVDQIFAIKKRPNDKPLIILMSDQSQMVPFVKELPNDFDKLSEHFWPGALTLVTPILVQAIPENVRAGKTTAGFRIPNHPLTLELLKNFGPVVAPSANLSAGPSATNAAHVEQDFGKAFPVLDGGDCIKGVESTILCFQDDRWQISRLGAVGVGQLQHVLGYPPQMLKTSPQTLGTGYTPKVKLHLSSGDYDGSIKFVLGFAGREYPGAKKVFSLGSLENPSEIGPSLYKILREVDQQNIPELWVDFNFPREGVLAFVAEKLEFFNR